MSSAQATGPDRNVLDDKQAERCLEVIVGDGLDWGIMFPPGTKREALVKVLREALYDGKTLENADGRE